VTEAAIVVVGVVVVDIVDAVDGGFVGQVVE
jgi:hypothetical protein